MYLFYVDESGNLNVSCREHRWLYTLTAVGIFEHSWRKFYVPLVEHKRQLIHTMRTRTDVRLDLHQCEVKCAWLRNEKTRNEKSLFLSSLTHEERTELAMLYYQQMAQVHAVCVSIAIDKRELYDYFDQQKLHRKAWELLCERIELYMLEHHRKHRAVLITDDVSRQENKSLADKHAYFLSHGTSSGLRLQRIVELPLFVRSELSEGIQLADLCAYNLYHSITYSKPNYSFFTRLLPHYYNSANTAQHKLDGLKMFPETSTTLTDWSARLEKIAPAYMYTGAIN